MWQKFGGVLGCPLPMPVPSYRILGRSGSLPLATQLMIRTYLSKVLFLNASVHGNIHLKKWNLLLWSRASRLFIHLMVKWDDLLFYGKIQQMLWLTARSQSFNCLFYFYSFFAILIPLTECSNCWDACIKILTMYLMPWYNLWAGYKICARSPHWSNWNISDLYAQD